MACLDHIRYHCVLLRNEIAVDWLSVAMWFGTYSCLSARMWTSGLVVHCLWWKPLGLVYPIGVTGKKSGWDMVLTSMKYVMAMTYRWASGWWECPCRILIHFCQSKCASWEVWVGWDRVALWSLRCQSLLLTAFVGSRTWGCWFGLAGMYYDVLSGFGFVVGSDEGIGSDAV